MHRGYIKLWRKMMDWEWFDNPLLLWFFVNLVFMANWEDKKWHGITIKRGQFVSSRENLRFVHGKGNRKKRLTTMQVRTLILCLKSTGEITTESTSQFTIYTIVNYELYQKHSEDLTSQTTSHDPAQQPTNNQPTTTTKEVKELKKLKNKHSASQFFKNEATQHIPDWVTPEWMKK